MVTVVRISTGAACIEYPDGRAATDLMETVGDNIGARPALSQPPKRRAAMRRVMDRTAPERKDRTRPSGLQGANLVHRGDPGAVPVIGQVPFLDHRGQHAARPEHRGAVAAGVADAVIGDAGGAFAVQPPP